jgi:hypothetical protein
MSVTLFLIFNHHFTARQEADARATLGIAQIVRLPEELGQLWGNIPPELTALADHLEPLQAWLLANAKKGDYVLIQGDFGACCLMVEFARRHGFVPIYATTRREAAEEVQPDGSIQLTHRFEHQMFRRYGV